MRIKHSNLPVGKWNGAAPKGSSAADSEAVITKLSRLFTLTIPEDERSNSAV